MHLKGSYTALITPLQENGEVDHGALRALVDTQIAGGVEGLVPVGTTGESATLSSQEHLAVIETVVKHANGRAVVIAGSGSNATAEAVTLTQEAANAGADATLQVAPYYNKPNQEGLYRHFSTIAEKGGLPVVVYNIPGRSAITIEVETLGRLAAHPRVVAVKEATGAIQQTMALIERCQTEIAVLSGDDNLTLPIIAMGGHGVISVASNIVPREVATMTQLALRGEWGEARAMHYRLLPLFRGLFIDTNPIPIKCALAQQGHIREVYRLPLCALSPHKREMLTELLRSIGLV